MRVVPRWAAAARERRGLSLVCLLQKASEHKKKKPKKKEKEERPKDKKKPKKKQPPGEEAAEPVENGALADEPLPVRGTSLAPRGPEAPPRPAEASTQGQTRAESRSRVCGPAGGGASVGAGG